MSEVYIYGKAVKYNQTGQGKCIVLLHGYLESKEVWNNFIKHLAGYRIIMPDLPGHGASAVFKEIHTMEFMADAVYAILEKEQISKCIMYGHSMGGYVTEAFARKYPHKLDAMGLLHSTIYADNEEKKNNRKREIALLQEGKQSMVVSGMLPNIVATAHVEAYQEQLNTITERAKNFPVAGIIAILNGMMERPAHTVDKNLPFHLIGSDQDNFIPLDVYQKMADDNPSVYFDLIEGCGHASFIEKPADAASKIKEFTSRVWEQKF